MRFPALLAISVAAAGAFGPSLSLAASKTEVDVIVDFTPEGRLIVHPSPGHPAYYLPIVGGYEERGQEVNGEKPPSPHDVIHAVAKELAKQGYLVTNPGFYHDRNGVITYADGTRVTVPPNPGRGSTIELNAAGSIPLTLAMLEAPDGPYSIHAARLGMQGGRLPPAAVVLRTVDPVHGAVVGGMPSLILAFHWGYMDPAEANFDPGGDNGGVQFNRGEMLKLVGGNTLDHLDLDFEREPVMQGAEQDRYFMTLSAYDFDAYTKSHKKVLLWQAKLSAPSDGVSQFSDVLAALLEAGGPNFGRETYRPKMQVLPVTPEGQVKVGTPTVKYDDTEDPAVSAPSGAK